MISERRLIDPTKPIVICLCFGLSIVTDLYSPWSTLQMIAEIIMITYVLAKANLTTLCKASDQIKLCCVSVVRLSSGERSGKLE